ncbi:MAG: sigma-70 family RNA polymerase sigma factor [Planctomycetota bacterium]
MELTAEQIVQHADFVRRLARSLVRDADAAEDIAQETIAEALGHDRPVRAPRSWLAAVVRHRAARRFRGEARRARREAVAARRGHAPSAQEVAAQAELQTQLAKEVLALEEPYRTVVVLRFFHDLSPREIARQLDEPYETVRSRLRRALAMLRARLDDRHDGKRGAWLGGVAVLASPKVASARVAVALLVAATAGVVALTFLLGGSEGDPEPMRAQSDDTDAARSAVVDEPPPQEPEPTPSQQPAVSTLRATGLVTTSWDEPIANARVVAMPPARAQQGKELDPTPLAETKTASDGTFTLNVPERRESIILAHAPGHAWTSRGVHPEVRRARIHIRLPAVDGIRGVVVDEGGTPVAGAVVFGMALGAAIPGARVVTGRSGAFTLPGASYVRVEHDKLAVVDRGGSCPKDRVRVVLGRAERVTGAVLAADGTPVERAVVRVCDGRGIAELGRAVTGVNGRFVVERLPLREGAAMQISVDGGDHGSLLIGPVAFASGLYVELKLAPVVTVEGRVIEMQGSEVVGPVAGVTVRRAPLRRGFAPGVMQEATTRADGRFQLTGMPAQTDPMIEVVDRRFVRDWRAKPPGAEPDERILVVRRVPFVEGRVVDGEGNPVVGAALGVGRKEPNRFRMDPDHPFTPVTDAEGRFRAPAHTGKGLRVFVRAVGFRPGRSEPMTLQDADVRTGLRIPLDTGATLVGTVAEPGGAPIPGARIGWSGGLVHADGRGAFRLAGLEHGSINLYVSAPGRLSRMLSAVVPAAGEPLIVTLEPGRTFRGRLRTADDKPLAHALVGRSGGSNEGDGWTRTDENGAFALRGLPPGTYGLVLRQDGWELTEPKARYDLTSDRDVEARVQPQHDGRIAGIVVDQHGEPFPLEATPTVTAKPVGTDDRGQWHHALCAPNGRFVLTHLGDGPHTLEVSSANAVFEPRTVKTGKTDVRLQAATPRTLDGRVLAPDGTPVPGCAVRALPPGATPRSIRGPNGVPSLLWPARHRVIRTDAEGRFAFTQLVGDEVVLWAEHPNHPLLQEPMKTGTPNAELRLTQGKTIRGVLLDANQKPAPKHSLFAVGTDGMVRHHRTNNEGAFVLSGLPDGKTEITVLTPQGQVIARATHPAGTSDLEIQLPPTRREE